MERQAASVWAVVSVISSPQVEKIWRKKKDVLSLDSQPTNLYI